MNEIISPINLHQCGLCHSTANILFTSCGHSVHGRCIPAWPLSHCPMCSKVVSSIELLISEIEGDVISERPTRKGRWLNNEWEYVQHVESAFRRGILPIGEAVKLKKFLCDVLQCGAPRLSTKIKTGKLSYHSKINGTECQEDLEEISSALRALAQSEELFFAAVMEYDAQGGAITCARIEQEWALQFQAHAFAVGQSVVVKKFPMSQADLVALASRYKGGLSDLNGDSMWCGRSVGKGMGAGTEMDDIGRKRTCPIMSFSSFGSFGSFPSSPDTVSSPHFPHKRVISSDISSIDSLVQALQEVSPMQSPRETGADSGYFFGVSPAVSEQVEDMVCSRSSAIWGECNVIPQSAPHLRTSDIECFLYSLMQRFPYDTVDLWAPVFFKNKMVLAMGAKATMLPSLHPWLDYSSQFVFEMAAGVPGRVHTTNCNEVIADLKQAHVNQFHRLDGALLSGIRSTVALPVRSTDGTVLVCMLYSTKGIVPNERQMEEMLAFLKNWNLSVQAAVFTSSDCCPYEELVDEYDVPIVEALDDFDV